MKIFLVSIFVIGLLLCTAALPVLLNEKATTRSSSITPVPSEPSADDPFGPAPSDQDWKQYPSQAGPFTFPIDEGVHPAFPWEWWYLNGHLVTADGERFDYMICFFKNGILSASLLDITNDNYLNSTQTFQDIRTDLGRLYVKYGANMLYQVDARPFTYQLEYYGPEFSLTVLIESNQGPLVVSNNDIVPMGQGASYYYSMTNMSSTGNLTVGSKEAAVVGTAWMDRQWGYWNPLQDWEWFSMTLENGMQLLVYKLFDNKFGSNMYLFVSAMDDQGRTYFIDQTWEKASIVIDYERYWRSPSTHQLYSSGWTITIPDLLLNLHIEPLKIDQEVLFLDGGTGSLSLKPFWEGASCVEGTYLGQPISGQAFVETSYDYGHVRGDLGLQLRDVISEPNHNEIFVKVENKGGYSLDKVEVVLMAGDPYDGAKILSFAELNDVDNSTYFSMPVPNDEGQPLYLIVDPNNRIAETNEINNIIMVMD